MSDGGHAVICVRALARAMIAGSLDSSAPVEEVTASIMTLPGFGDWTAQYFALRALGEPDAFPASDLVLSRVAALDDAPLTTRAIEARAGPWRPWRGYTAFRLWRAASDAANRTRAG